MIDEDDIKFFLKRSQALIESAKASQERIDKNIVQLDRIILKESGKTARRRKRKKPARREQ